MHQLGLRRSGGDRAVSTGGLCKCMSGWDVATVGAPACPLPYRACGLALPDPKSCMGQVTKRAPKASEQLEGGPNPAICAGGELRDPNHQPASLATTLWGQPLRESILSWPGSSQSLPGLASFAWR